MAGWWTTAAPVRCGACTALAGARERDTDRDHFMGAEEARAWGLIDQVLVPKKA